MRYNSHCISQGVSFALLLLYVSGNLILNSLFTSSTSTSSSSSRRVVFIIDVSNLALPMTLPKGLSALGYSHNPDIVIFLLIAKTINSIKVLKV